MLFQLKVKDQKNRFSRQTVSKIEKIKSMLNKVKLVARNVVYVKKWSDNNSELQKITNPSHSFFLDSRNLNINIGCFLIKIINDDHSLMCKVKELRQKSFFKDSESNKKDSDEFDKLCDHLVVIDKSISDDFVVGTYRLLLKPKYAENQKFYSQLEFDISNLLNRNDSTLLEAGRSCVHEDYRDGRIIKLLWRGLATYIANNNVDLIFGCASFPSSNHNLFLEQLSYLYHFHRAPNFLKTKPIEKLRACFDVIDKKLINRDEQFRKLPPLIKAYIRVGSWIGQGAIIDKEFDTTDVLIVLNSKKILKKYIQLSFQKNQ